MPYIPEEARQRLGNGHSRIHGVGELNFVLTVFCDEYLKEAGMNYENLNAIIGVLESMKLEFYRRRAVPYEDKKIEENGDVYLDYKLDL